MTGNEAPEGPTFRTGRWLVRLARSWRRPLSIRDSWERRWADPGYEPPWALSAMSPAALAVIRDGWFAAGSRLIDVGCAEGSFTVELAGLGFEVLGIDFAPSAIARARHRAAAHTRPPRFQVCDITVAMPSGGPFDGLVDKCCLHAMPMADVEAYGRNVASILTDHARLLVLARLQGQTATRSAGVSRDVVLEKVDRAFGATFRTVSVGDVLVAGPEGAKGLVVRLERA